MYSIYREKKKEVKKKSGKGSNDHMTIGKGEMENITVVSQRSHDRWNLEIKGGPVGREGRRVGEKRAGSREGEEERRERGRAGKGKGIGEEREEGRRSGRRRGAGLFYFSPWAEPWALKNF